MEKELLTFVALMIFYDLSIHLVYLFKKENFLLKRKLNWWPNWNKWGYKEQRDYQVFWSIFWGTAFVLIISLIFYEK